jgi:hypothetical protein
MQENGRKHTKDETEEGHNCAATLVGLRADPTSCPEDWESDFDFDSSTSILPPPAAARGAGHLQEPSPAAGSSPRAVITVSERRDLEELLKTLPTYAELSENVVVNDQIPSAPLTKMSIKDLLREMQHSNSPFADPINDLQTATKNSTDSPKAGSVESHEWNLAVARGRHNAQVFLFKVHPMHFFKRALSRCKRLF